MFNKTAPFNQTLFNRSRKLGGDYSVSGIAGIAFVGHVRAATIRPTSGFASLVFQGLASPARARLTGGSAGISFGGMASVVRTISIIPSIAGLVFVGDVRAEAGYLVVPGVSGLVFQGAAKSTAHHSGGITGISGVRFTGYVSRMQRNIAMGDSMAGIMFAGSADVKFRNEESFSLSMTLAPGQSVVIDTNYFTVMRDGTNMIQAHSGAWPQLQRGSFRLEVVANGTTTNELIYQEQWL